MSEKIRNMTIGELVELEEEISKISTIGEWKEVLRKFRDKNDLDDKSAIAIGNFINRDGVKSFLRKHKQGAKK